VDRASGQTSDPQADWGKHETRGVDGRTGKPWTKIKSWFGYGLHLIADTHYEIPVAMALTPAEMDFAGLKEAAAREIALAFGVPPVLLGLPGDATYAKYREANRALWNQSIIPLARKILDALAQGLRPYFDGLTLDLDLDAIPALAEDRERLWAQVGAADFLTTQEKRAAVGIGGGVRMQHKSVPVGPNADF
jgi:phage portal protein BeeE